MNLMAAATVLVCGAIGLAAGVIGWRWLRTLGAGAAVPGAAARGASGRPERWVCEELEDTGQTLPMAATRAPVRLPGRTESLDAPTTVARSSVFPETQPLG
jgi:hypothetical protein